MKLSIVVLCIALLATLAQARLLDQESVIAVVNKANAGWKAGINRRFNGTTVAFARLHMGVLETPNELRLPTQKIDVRSDLPSDFDAREQWTNCSSIGEIRDQSACGSCWAFAAVEAATDRICIQAGKIIHLSAEDLVSCCDSCGMGCNGGYPEAAWSWFTDTGVVTGGNYGDYSWCQAYSMPWCDHHVTGKYGPCPSDEYPTPGCSRSCDSNSTYNVGYTNDKKKFKTSYSVSSDESAIRTDIFNNGPVEAAFTVYEDFLAYKSGVYKHVTGSELGGHAVKIFGWGTESGNDYWWVANSWNTDWGLDGTFKIARGTDECGIEDEIVAGMAV